MNKKSISSFELAALVNELQFIVGGKLSQIYHQDKMELLFSLHARGKGKQLLKIIPGKFLCLTSEKGDIPLRPTGFCMQLRKYVSNASINKIEQKNSERIVIFELEKNEKFYLIIELFSKGNIILTNSEYKIIGTLQRQIWKDRSVKAHEQYVFPASDVNWKLLQEKRLKEILSNSEKRNIATTLATEVGLGGLYAEEVCKRAGIDKNLLPADVKKVKEIIGAIKEMLLLIHKSSGLIYENQITPFELLDEEIKEKRDTYNQAIDTINPFQKISPYKQRIATIEKTISMQKEAIKKQEDKIELNTRKGEVIYEKYAKLQKMIDIVDELKKEKGWDEIKASLRKEKKIVSVDLKKKSVVINL